MPNQGDIVLIPVPFTDLSAQKQRPVIIVSNTQYNQTSPDMVVVAMTSNPVAVPFSFSITSNDLERGTLNRPGKVRVDKIYALSQTLIRRTFATVNTATLQQIQTLLADLVALKP